MLHWDVGYVAVYWIVILWNLHNENVRKKHTITTLSGILVPLATQKPSISQSDLVGMTKNPKSEAGSRGYHFFFFLSFPFVMTQLSEFLWVVWYLHQKKNLRFTFKRDDSKKSSIWKSNNNHRKSIFKTHHCTIFSSFKTWYDLNKVPPQNSNYKILKALYISISCQQN